MTSIAPSLGTINDDVALIIFGHLGIGDKARMRLVNSRFKELGNIALSKQDTLSIISSNDAPRWVTTCEHIVAPRNTLRKTISMKTLRDLMQSTCTRLKALNLHKVLISNMDLKILSRTEGWKKLVHLEICYCSMNDVKEVTLVKALQRATSLVHLVLYKSTDSISNAVLAACPEKLSICTLGFYHYNMKLSLDKLGPKISKLEIHGLGLAAKDITKLASRPSYQNAEIEYLRIRNFQFNDEALDQLHKFPNLKALDIPMPSPGTLGLLWPILLSFDKLDSISISHRFLCDNFKIDPVVMNIALKMGSSLRSLKVGLFNISDEAVETVCTHCPGLVEFHAVYNEVYFFRHLYPCSDARFEITDRSAKDIQKLTSLKVLNLSLSKITDSGVAEILQSCTQLRRLELNCCNKITVSSVLAFMKLAGKARNEQFTISVIKARNVRFGPRYAQKKRKFTNVTVLLR